LPCPKASRAQHAPIAQPLRAVCRALRDFVAVYAVISTEAPTNSLRSGHLQVGELPCPKASQARHAPAAQPLRAVCRALRDFAASVYAVISTDARRTAFVAATFRWANCPAYPKASQAQHAPGAQPLRAVCRALRDFASVYAVISTEARTNSSLRSGHLQVGELPCPKASQARHAPAAQPLPAVWGSSRLCRWDASSPRFQLSSRASAQRDEGPASNALVVAFPFCRRSAYREASGHGSLQK
jgi:hypothetical protein